KAAAVAVALFDELDAAELTQGFGAGLRVSHAAQLVLAGREVEMASDFVVEVLLEFSAGEVRGQAFDQDAEPGHWFFLSKGLLGGRAGAASGTTAPTPGRPYRGFIVWGLPPARCAARRLIRMRSGVMASPPPIPGIGS